MDLNLIATFVRVVEAGSFTAAARTLGLPRSSVSRAITRLEESLGVALLQRTTRKLGLTPAGELYYERVRGAVLELGDASGEVSDLGKKPRGVVRMTAPPDSQDVFRLPEVLAGFIALHPKIEIELTLTARRVDLVAEHFDLALRAGQSLEDSSLLARKLMTASLGLYAAPAYLERRGTPQRFSDLTDHEFVLLDGLANVAIELRGPTGNEPLSPRGPITVNDMSFAARFAAEGVGIGVLPDLNAQSFLESGALQHVLPEYAMLGGAVWLVTAANKQRSVAVRLLRDHLIAALTPA